jgi:hypothetical protein
MFQLGDIPNQMILGALFEIFPNSVQDFIEFLESNVLKLVKNEGLSEIFLIGLRGDWEMGFWGLVLESEHRIYGCMYWRARFFCWV